MTDPRPTPDNSRVSSSNQDFWEERYRTKDMPWEKGQASPGLVDFLRDHPTLAKGTVLVPGCGLGHDVRTWAQAGFQAHGLDIAPSAVQLGQERSGQMPATFHQGDFLGDPPFLTFDWLFEHTLFCAIQPDRRPDYVQAVRRWLKPEGHFLAVYYLLPPDNEGPPFSTTRAEVLERFGPYFEHIQDWVPRSYPNRTNLEWMVWWRRRPGRA